MDPSLAIRWRRRGQEARVAGPLDRDPDIPAQAINPEDAYPVTRRVHEPRSATITQCTIHSASDTLGWYKLLASGMGGRDLCYDTNTTDGVSLRTDGGQRPVEAGC